MIAINLNKIKIKNKRVIYYQKIAININKVKNK